MTVTAPSPVKVPLSFPNDPAADVEVSIYLPAGETEPAIKVEVFAVTFGAALVFAYPFYVKWDEDGYIPTERVNFYVKGGTVEINNPPLKLLMDLCSALSDQIPPDSAPIQQAIKDGKKYQLECARADLESRRAAFLEAVDDESRQARQLGEAPSSMGGAFGVAAQLSAALQEAREVNSELWDENSRQAARAMSAEAALNSLKVELDALKPSIGKLAAQTAMLAARLDVSNKAADFLMASLKTVCGKLAKVDPTFDEYDWMAQARYYLAGLSTLGGSVPEGVNLPEGVDPAAGLEAINTLYTLVGYDFSMNADEIFAQSIVDQLKARRDGPTGSSGPACDIDPTDPTN